MVISRFRATAISVKYRIITVVIHTLFCVDLHLHTFWIFSAVISKLQLNVSLDLSSLELSYYEKRKIYHDFALKIALKILKLYIENTLKRSILSI